MSVNADGSISSTTGHVEDSKAAVPPTLMGSGKKDEPEKDYITDENGNLIDPDTGEIVAPNEPGTGTDTPDTEPTTPENPGTGTDDSGTGSGAPGADTPEQPGTGDASENPEGGAIIVVPPEPAEPGNTSQELDPVTGEPLPAEG